MLSASSVVMPTAGHILFWAAAVANDWRWLAILWHIALAALVIAVVSGWQASYRLVGSLLLLPVISVGVIAWVSGNPFNGLAFSVLAVVLFAVAMHLPHTPVTPASPGWVSAGAALTAVGWVYPHFLTAHTWTVYAYASPFGLLPCPTLAVVIGVTLIFGGLQSTAWSVCLFPVGVLYGVIGVFGLGVGLDLALLAGATLLGALVVERHVVLPVRATDDERTRRLAGDEFITVAVGALTHAITIAGAPSAVWPWLVQMGAGSRAGWYSYDVLDNGREPSATRIVPELQSITVGTLFPAGPGMREGFVVRALEPQRSLVLCWPNPDGSAMVTWAFVLERRPGDSTRLIVRVRGGQGYRFHSLPLWLSDPVIRVVHFVMQRKQLLGIARRTEPIADSRPW
jgi:hypothetical protein